jgi:hypothetical protein
MARPYISIGRGGPRVGVVLGARDVSDIAKICLVGFGAVAILATLLNLNASPPVIIASPFVILAGMFWHGVRKARKAREARNPQPQPSPSDDLYWLERLESAKQRGRWPD